MVEPQNCQAEACNIQTCMSETNYSSSKCAHTVEALYRCCDAMYRAADRENRPHDTLGTTGSTACPVKSVVERKLREYESGVK